MKVQQRFLFVAIAYYILCTSPASATLISSSEIRFCGTKGDGSVPDCDKKIVVTLAVSPGEGQGTEDVVFVSSAVDHTTGLADPPTVNFAPVTVSVSRTPVTYLYATTYIADFNGKPYETTIKGTLFHQCNDDFSQSKATCGLKSDPKSGVLIPFSQGFCCSCSACQASQLCTTDARGSCDVFADYSTASCLRFGEDWYAGYTIGGSSPSYELNVTLTTPPKSPESTDANNTGTRRSGSAAPVTRVLRLDPAHTGASDSEMGVVARILGDFAPGQSPLDLSSHVLFIPSLPYNSPRVLAGAKEYMLVEQTLVSLDGRECNKVGTSYEAFATQGNACKSPRGTCLASQLDDLRASDVAAAAAGKRGRYMLPSFGDLDLSNMGSAGVAGLAYQAVGASATMLTLDIRADDLQYVVAVADGKIVDALVTPQPLLASTTDGVLAMKVENVGSLAASFALSVSCGPGVFPIPEMTLALEPQKPVQHNVSVLVQATGKDGEITCHLVLRDSQEAQVDSRNISVNVKHTDWKNSTDDSDNHHHADSTAHYEEDHARSCEYCGSVGFACMISRACWRDLVHWCVAAAVIAVVVILVCMLWPCLSFLCCCCHCCCSSSSTTAAAEHRHSEPFAETRV